MSASLKIANALSLIKETTFQNPFLLCWRCILSNLICKEGFFNKPGGHIIIKGELILGWLY
jgi:hypothetical protein